jgi:hypothetical protein
VTSSDPNNSGDNNAGQHLLAAIDALSKAQQNNNEVISGLSTLLESVFTALVVVADRMQIDRQVLAQTIASERENIRRFFQQGN